MYDYRKLDEGLFYVGAGDRRLELFENMFPLPNGVAYNSYVLLDEKTVLFDTIDNSVLEQYLENVKAVLDGRDLDYLIVHHLEPDHCAGIERVMERYQKAILLCSKKAKDLLEQFYGVQPWWERIQLIAEGDTLETGSRTLQFVGAPMVHWPEVLMTYETTRGWLFSADAFGAFGALDGHVFADQVNLERDWMEPIRRYYVNIVGRQGNNVAGVLRKAAALDIRMILPLHGLVFRTKEDIALMIEKYRLWSTYQAEEDGVVLVYGSMYGASQLAVEKLASVLADKGVKNLRIFDVSKTHYSSIISELFRFSNAVFACNNYNTELFPMMDAMLRELMMLNFDNHKVSLIYNMSWGGKAAQIARDILEKGKKMEFVGEVLTVKSALKAEQLPQVEALADAIIESMS
ncbi:MAG: FprA family A-type flavoprotein [Eubacteriales bacterium]|nr:FprA family A-type flavoprotein [Eubacteriales bacterium]